MWIKTIVQYHYKPIRMANIQDTNNIQDTDNQPNAGQDVEQ